MNEIYFLDHNKKQRVYLRRVRHGIASAKQQANSNTVTLSGEWTVSKIFWDKPIVLNGTKYQSLCSVCANKHVCMAASNKRNRAKCVHYLASNICSSCSRYDQCYPMRKAQCKRMAADDEEFGFVIARPTNIEVPVPRDIKTTFDMAMAIGRKNRLITWMLQSLHKRDPSLYRTWTVPKKNGGQRSITAPTSILKWLQRAILERLLYQVPRHPCSYGFEPGISIVSNADVHSDKDVVVSVDLKDFFPSIKFPRVYGVLQAVGFQKKIAGAITAICTWQGALPQGAPTSPKLANMVAYRMDAKLRSYLNNRGWVYTRYADDITFSFSQADNPNTPLKSVDGVLAVVKRIVEEEGFVVNEDKTKIMRRGRRQWVTGLVANESPSVLRHKVKRIRAAIHNAKTHGLKEAADARKVSRDKYRRWVEGNLAFLHMVDSEKADKMKQEWELVK